MTDRNLESKDEITALILKEGINTWNELVNFVKSLPYGRNSNRTDLTLVLTEKKGSCSSKHAFLKKVADLNNIPNIKLILGIYKMNEHNTPKIGNALKEYTIDFIPEAHCYLKIEERREDITSLQSNFDNLADAILEELEIEPDQVATFKVDYHKEYLKNWLLKSSLKLDFDTLWQIREQCISNLSKNK